MLYQLKKAYSGTKSTLADLNLLILKVCLKGKLYFSAPSKYLCVQSLGLMKSHYGIKFDNP